MNTTEEVSDEKLPDNVLPLHGQSTGWKIMVLPGGRKPRLGTLGAAGLDLYTRAIVSVKEDKRHPEMRETLSDFTDWFDNSVAEHVHRIGDEWVYVLKPKHTVRIGVGIVIELPMNQAGYIHPRGSTANNRIELSVANEDGTIVVKNAGVPIDSDFRGEPSALLYNDGDRNYYVRKHSRLVQLVRTFVAYDPPIDIPTIVESLCDMSSTFRGFGQNASTGNG